MSLVGGSVVSRWRVFGFKINACARIVFRANTGDGKGIGGMYEAGPSQVIEARRTSRSDYRNGKPMRKEAIKIDYISIKYLEKLSQL